MSPRHAHDLFATLDERPLTRDRDGATAAVRAVSSLYSNSSGDSAPLNLKGGELEALDEIHGVAKRAIRGKPSLGSGQIMVGQDFAEKHGISPGDSIGLDGLGNRNANNLSGGQKQRVAIAPALMNRPSLVLADEPTGDLDTTDSAAVYDLFRRVNLEAGTAFLIVTHDPPSPSGPIESWRSRTADSCKTCGTAACDRQGTGRRIGAVI